MTVSDQIVNFLNTYFWLPIIDETVHYNPYNTIVYALIFGIAVVYVGLPLIKRLGLEIDRRFFISLMPFIFLGGSARSLQDIGVLDTFLLESPLIFVWMFLLAVTTLWTSIRLEKHLDIGYHIFTSTLGWLLFITTLLFYNMPETGPLTLFLISVAAWTFSGYILLKIFRPDLVNFLFTIPVASHLLDASTTFAGVSYGATEKHVVANYFINLIGPAGIFVLKIGVIVPIVYYIFRNMKGGERAYYLFIISVLGLGIATRNFFSIIMA